MYRELSSFKSLNNYFVLLVLLIVSFIFILVVFFVRRPKIGIYFFNGSNSSSSISSNSCGSSGSSSGDPKRDSFWKKYWKVIVGSVVVISVGLSAVIYYYYHVKISIEPEDLDTIYTIVQSNNYYLTTSNDFVSFSAVVLENPGDGQYAPFSIYWDNILRSTVSEEEYDAVIALLDVNSLKNRDSLVLTSEDFDEVVFLVTIAREELINYVNSR